MDNYLASYYTKLRPLELNDVVPATDWQPVADERAVLLRVLKEIERVGPRPGGTNWDDYWRQHVSAEAPTYLNRSDVFRWRGRYITAPPSTEKRYFAALKQQCFQYFAGLDSVIEIGCGSCANLVDLRDMHLVPNLYGWDRSAAAADIARGLFGKTRGDQFDMAAPPDWRMGDFPFGVLTSGAMEQLGGDFERFQDFLLQFGAEINVHIEPFEEFYNPDDLFDYVALKYHRKRDYLGNFISRLRRQPNVRILECYRTGFGNWLNEGYMVLVWRVRK